MESLELSPLSELVGQTIEINPAKLVNRKLLYTTQNWIDVSKLTKALKGEVNDTDIPSGWVFQKEDKTVYIVGDGNHRIGLACINGGNVSFFIKGIWPNNKNLPYQFNIIIKKIREMEIGLSK